MKLRIQKPEIPIWKNLVTLICVGQVLAMLLTGIVAARPDLASENSSAKLAQVQTAEEFVAGVGDTSPTDDAATSDPTSQTDSHGWWTAQLTTQETVRSIRFVSSEISLSRTEAYVGYSEILLVHATLGDVSSELPYRFALVGQRPSGTS